MLFCEQFFTYKLVSAEDTLDNDLLAHFDECVQFIASGAKSGRRTLVHCAAGISRSATICVAYLVKQHRMGVDEALALVTARRPIVCPNEGFLRQLRQYAQRQPRCALQ